MTKIPMFELEEAIDRQPLTVAPTLPVAQVLAVMERQHSSYVLLMESNQTLVGIFTERDLVRLTAIGIAITSTPIEEVATSTVTTIQESDIYDVIRTLNLFRQYNVRHLPVVNATHQLIGIMTYEGIRRLLKPIDLLRLRRVSEVMVKSIICADRYQSALSLAKLMSDRLISCVVITEKDPSGFPKPIGLVTERDILHLQVQGADLSQTIAADFMGSPPVFIQASDTLWQANQYMRARKIRRLLVVDERNIMVGLLTQTSLIHMIDPVEATLTIETLQQMVGERTVALDAANEKLERKALERKRAKAALQQQIYRERLVNRTAQRIRESLQLDEILVTTVSEVRQFLKAERVLIYRFQPNQQGAIAAESTDSNQTLIQGNAELEAILQEIDPTFYSCDRIHSIPDLQAQGLELTNATLLKRLQLRASLVAPIFAQEILWGLLIVGQNSQPRRWEKLEIDLLKQLATQVGIAIQQARLYAQLAAANQQLLRLAQSDGLTGLANRRHFDQCLDIEWQRAIREQHPLGLILIDIDCFKQFNDTYGHQAGDDCLKAVATALTQVIARPADLVARYGGEEFVVILPNTNEQGILQIAESMRSAVQQLKIPHRSSSVCPSVSLSLGAVTWVPTPHKSPEALIAAADQALYQAKELGRNRVCLAGVRLLETT
ncbi:diguanylate cyclase domain-containing protein [Synechococcus elongatus]|uniref:diguanylate cyclase domain-containing protein n=1 Tax=Synechococcus elongatus TaxID=32046 RepID=UPI000F7D9042|nr:diguanylate cyclase [Synechococcus elongatus]